MATPTYDDYMNSEKWVAHIKGTFDVRDVNKNGWVEADDWMQLLENIKREVNPDPSLMDKLTKATKDLVVAMGLTPGAKLDKDQYVQTMAKMAIQENERRAKGKQSLRHAINNAWFEVVDKNHDGNVTLDEFVTVMKTNGIDPQFAEATFKTADKNNNGKIDRKELLDFLYNFWFSLELYK